MRTSDADMRVLLSGVDGQRRRGEFRENGAGVVAGGMGYKSIDHHDGAKRACLMMPCSIVSNNRMSQRFESMMGAANLQNTVPITAPPTAHASAAAPAISSAAIYQAALAAANNNTNNTGNADTSRFGYGDTAAINSMLHAAASATSNNGAFAETDAIDGKIPQLNANTNSQKSNGISFASLFGTTPAPASVFPAAAANNGGIVSAARMPTSQATLPFPSAAAAAATSVAAATTKTEPALRANTSSPNAALLAEDLAQLSLQEQQQGHKDVIGEVDVIREGVEFIQDRLTKLDDAINLIKRKPVYDKAVFLSPKYVQDPMLRLMFLRADSFHVGKTATKLVKHFEMKLKLFGSEKLAKTITWDDLNDDDKAAYLSGASQISSNGDVCGRKIYYNMIPLRRYRHPDNQLRAVWYMFMKGIQPDVDSQRKGLVMVSYSLGTLPANFYASIMFQVQQRLDSILPIRFTAIHFCFDDQTWIGPLFSSVMSTISSSLRLRIRTHVGSNIECRYALASFGIPDKEFPLDINGQLNVTRFFHLHQKSIADELRDEQIRKERNHGLVEIVTRHDVLLGRGFPYQHFEGNLRLLSIVENAKSQYDTAKIRSSKTHISAEIVQLIKSAGGRFLKRDEVEGLWVEVDDEVSREKVSMTFRNLSRKQKKKAPGTA